MYLSKTFPWHFYILIYFFGICIDGFDERRTSCILFATRTLTYLIEFSWPLNCIFVSCKWNRFQASGRDLELSTRPTTFIQMALSSLLSSLSSSSSTTSVSTRPTTFHPNGLHVFFRLNFYHFSLFPFQTNAQQLLMAVLDKWNIHTFPFK